MYQQQQQVQSHQQHLCSRPSLPPESRQFVLQGGDSGLILSTDAKPRLKWTTELHERFVEAVNQLGGPEKATPKTIMRLMGIPGLTLYHLKSHLQKYRLSKNLPGQANAVHHAKNVSGCRTATDKLCEGDGSPASHFSLEPQMNRSSMHISEALQMQIEVQRRLQEQLEVQRHVQLRIEAQGKYLQSVLEKAQEALAKRSSGVDRHVNGLASSKTQVVPAKSLRQHEHGIVGDGSVDSCLTAACGEGTHSYYSRPFQMRRGGYSSSQQQLGGGGEEEEGRRRRASEEHMYRFLEEPSGGGGASPDDDDDRCCDETASRDDDDDGFFGSARILDDLISINNNTSSTCRRPRADCDRIIDLNNGSSWN